MNRHVAIAALLACLGSEVSAQPEAPRMVRFDHPEYGMTVDGELDQLERPASELRAGCPGLVTRAPTLIVQVDGGPARLVFELGAAGVYDKTIVIRTGDQVACGTDLDSLQVTAERVEVWLGGTEYSDHGRWQLRISERPSLPPAPTPATASPDLRFAGEALQVAGQTPDPTTARMIYAGDYLPGCAVSVPQLAQHVLELRAPVDELRILARSDRTDLGLLVQRPDGSFACGAKIYGDQPAVQERFEPGLYRLWIGRAGFLSALGDYALTIEERPPGTMPASAAPHQPSWPHHARELVIEAGAARGQELRVGGAGPPIVRRGTTAGRIPATNLTPGCIGHVIAEPTHALVVTEPTAYLRLVAETQGGGGLSDILVLRTPGGRFHCAAPGDARSTAPIKGAAELELHELEPGTYLVWVGTGDRQEAEYALAAMHEPGLAGEALYRLLWDRD